MLQPPTAPVGLQIKTAMKEAQININRICLNTVPDPPAYDPERNNLIERVAKVDNNSVHASNKASKEHLSSTHCKHCASGYTWTSRILGGLTVCAWYDAH